MIESSVIHDTFAIERKLLATPARVFAAFASAEARQIWGCTAEVEEADGEVIKYELDFRPGGLERFGFKSRGTTYVYDARFYDIVADQRIIYSYELYADGVRYSVSVVTIEFASDGDGTTLVWTEQGTFLDGMDGPAAPKLREQGTAMLADELVLHLNAQAPR